MAGKLYVVGTPIGNLSDMSPRGISTLAKVDFIAAEDTRVSAKLLKHFNISAPMISYHKFSTEQREQDIIDRIAAGESCAVITDAGMPCISDPGEQLVKQCRDRGIEVEAVPGPSAAVTALSISGMDTARFSFEGFLSVTKKQRDKHLAEIKDMPHTLKNTLHDLYDALGDRPAALCRELTKLHEEVIRSSLSQLAEYYDINTPRGEYVIIVEGKRHTEQSDITLNTAAQNAARLVSEGIKPSDACRQAAEGTPFKRSEVYKEYLSLNGQANKEE